jgi:deoxyxylulose-5-phosphate synthase
MKETLKRLFLKENIFETLGFRYLGPYDGHDIKSLIKIFERAKNNNENVVIHVVTKKGKGYIPAETKPKLFHGVSKFNPDTGEVMPDFGVINDPDRFYKKYQTKDCELDALYILKANAPINTEAHACVQTAINSGRIKFLIDDRVAK